MKAKLAFAGLLSAALAAGGYWVGAINVSPSFAATTPQAATAQGTPVQTLPDFTAIVEANKAAVVNITAIGKAEAAVNPLEGLDEDSPFYAPEQQPDLGTNGIHYFLVGKGLARRQMCILREVMPPGSDTGDSMLAHDGEEGGVVISGRVEITIGEHVRVLGAGEAYYFESRQPHRFRNVGDVDAILVSASTPPTF